MKQKHNLYLKMKLRISRFFILVIFARWSSLNSIHEWTKHKTPFSALLVLFSASSISQNLAFFNLCTLFCRQILSVFKNSSHLVWNQEFFQHRSEYVLNIAKHNLHLKMKLFNSWLNLTFFSIDQTKNLIFSASIRTL